MGQKLTAMTGQASSGRRYEIVVRGRLSERYGAAFDGVDLEPRAGETVLRVEFVDQSQLYGLLNRLRDCGLELMSVSSAVIPNESKVCDAA